MGVPGNANALLLASAAVSGGYQVSRSLRFSSPDSSYLSKNFGSSGNRKTWTWAGWVKLGKLSNWGALFKAGSATASPVTQLYLYSDNTLEYITYSGSTQSVITTTQVFRDPSAWYHILLAIDTTQATANNRQRLYVNGTEVTTFASRTNHSQNYDTFVNDNTYAHEIGRTTNVGGASEKYFDGYLADIHFIDGQALEPSSFTETDATTGQLIPKAYTGSYGTNGFRLAFDSYATTAALGTDTSGNGNTWTVNNFSVTAGSGNDSLVDTPTSYGTDTGVGGSVRGNYAVLNPLSYTGTVTLSNGNLDATGSNANASSTIAPNAGKWYAEFVYSAIGSAVGFVGISNRLAADAFSGATQTWQLNYTNTGKLENAGSQSTVSTFTTGDVVGVAFDCSNGQATFYKNGSSVGTITGSAFIGVPVVFGAGAGGSSGTNTFVANFGQRAFAYTAPSGFKALVDTNLPTPVVAKPNTVMDVVLYTGTGAALTPTSSLGFNPDWIWIKSRSAATDHALYDVVRGAQARLESNTSDAEVTTDGGVTAFNSAGFTLGTLAQVNTSSATYAAWCWDAGTSTVTNTAGSISSQVRANASAGFSVVTVNSTTIGTIGHGLGVKPAMIIEKCRGTTSNWYVRHQSLGDMKSSYLTLNTTAAGGPPGDTTAWNNTEPTSTTISINNNYLYANGSVVYYCFAPVAGYSSMGSYVGNGSSDGVFVYTGMRPRFILVKCTTLSDRPWKIFDTSRDPYNGCNHTIYPNASDAETTAPGIRFDLLSNGFKLRTTGDEENGSGQTYIYYAVAESPLQYARAR